MKLTEYSKGAGCGCKIAPGALQEILQNHITELADEKLIIGNNTQDDAAVYALDENNYLISTTDFFTPIVNDAFDYGRIAAANAISDVYAMGGQPIMALAIMGWPLEKIPTEIANQVMHGAKSICKEAGIQLAGGHTIESQEPVFGLSVNGIVKKEQLKKNNTACEGDYLFLTKPIGIGLLTTAEKRNELLEEHQSVAVNIMTKLNKFGTVVCHFDWVTAMTDVTGFGLAGHLIEMCEGAKLSAELNWSAIPLIENLQAYITKGIRPDATSRNWNSYGSKLQIDKSIPMMEAFTLLPDPQTSGGLLISVKETHIIDMQKLLKKNQLEKFIEPIGRMIPQKEKAIYVI